MERAITPAAKRRHVKARHVSAGKAKEQAGVPSGTAPSCDTVSTALGRPAERTNRAVASPPSSAATISGSPSCPDAASRVSTSRCLHAGNSAAFESHAAHHSYRRRDSVPRQRPPVRRRQDSSAGERDGRKGGIRSRPDRPVLSTRSDGHRDSGAVRRRGRQVL